MIEDNITLDELGMLRSQFEIIVTKMVVLNQKSFDINKEFEKLYSQELTRLYSNFAIFEERLKPKEKKMSEDDWSIKKEIAIHGNFKVYEPKSLKTLRQKLIEDTEDYENPFVGKKFLNDNGETYTHFENFRKKVLKIINKRFGVEE